MVSDDSTDREEDLDAAAQYALGVGDAASRAAAVRRIATDPAFASQVAAWSERLHPLDIAYGEETPPPAMKQRIERELFGAGLASHASRPVSTVWRPVALAASIALLVSLGFNLRNALEPSGEPARLIVSLEAADSPVKFLALYEPGTRAVRLSQVAAPRQPANDYELWLVEGSQAPVSLGVLPQQGVAEIVVPPALAGRFAEGAALAISLEPQGGSPTGAPTGPIVASGALKGI
jgi:anti-sigma-K factor RskA